MNEPTVISDDEEGQENTLKKAINEFLSAPSDRKKRKILKKALEKLSDQNQFLAYFQDILKGVALHAAHIKYIAQLKENEEASEESSEDSAVLQVKTVNKESSSSNDTDNHDSVIDIFLEAARARFSLSQKAMALRKKCQDETDKNKAKMREKILNYIDNRLFSHKKETDTLLVEIKNEELNAAIKALRIEFVAAETEKVKARVNATGKSSLSEKVEIAHMVVTKGDAAFLASLLTLLSNVGHATKTLIDKYAFILFPIAFALKAFDFVVYAVKFFVSPNKNVGKLANLLIKAAETVAVGVAVFGAKALAPVVFLGAHVAAGPLIFMGIMGFGIAVNMAKTFTFLYRAWKAERNSTTEAFYLDKAGETLKNAVPLTFVLASLAIGLAFPPVGVGIGVAISVISIAAVVVVGVSVICRGTPVGDFLHNKIVAPVGNFFKNLFGFGKSAVPSNALNEEKQIKEEAELLIPQKENEREIEMKPLAKKSYYAASRFEPLALNNQSVKNFITDVEKDISSALNALNAQRDKSADSVVEQYFWSENAKLTNKVNALELLHKIIQKFPQILEAVAKDPEGEKSVTINQGVTITYTTVDDLIEKFDKRVITDYPNVYQSFFRETGGVQSSFRKSYQALSTADNLPPEERMQFIESRGQAMADSVKQTVKVV